MKKNDRWDFLDVFPRLPKKFRRYLDRLRREADAWYRCREFDQAAILEYEADRLEFELAAMGKEEMKLVMWLETERGKH
jgi:hypothetical protein